MNASLKAKLTTLFDIRPGEERVVGLLLLHSVLYGGTVSVAYTAAVALFLEAYSAAQLPWVYIIAAGIIVMTGVGYGWLGRRISFGALFVLTLVVLAAGGALVRVGLLLTPAAWLAFAALIWFRLLFSLSGLEFWGVAGRLLTLQQGKRLFGLVGAGEMLARMIAYALVPALVALLGTTDLLVLAVALLLVNTGVLVLLLRARGDSAESPPPTTARAPSAPPAAGGSPLRLRYVRLIAGASLLSMLLYFLIDYGFLQQVRAQYPDADALASFLGVVNSVAYGGGLLLRVFVAGWLLRRFGLRMGILILPIATLVPLVLIAVFGPMGSFGAVIFWSMVALRVINDLLRGGIFRSSSVLLYQPLDRHDRLAAQTTAEGIFEPLGIGLAGVTLLLVNRLPGFTPTQLGTIILVLTLAWTGMLIWTYRDYLAALTQALAKRALSGQQLTLTDGATLDAITRTLTSPHPGAVVYALELLDRAGAPATAAQLQPLLRHPDGLVRATALREVEKRHLPGFAPTLQQMLATDPDPAVRGAAMAAWTAVDTGDALPRLLPYLDDGHTSLRNAALHALLRHGGIAGVLAAGERLLRMVEAADPAERAAAATLLGDSEIRGFYQPLLPLLADPSPPVARAALAAAGKLNSPQLWPLVLDALGDPRLGRAAAAALEQGGNAVLPAVRQAFADQAANREVLLRLVQVLGRSGSAESIAFLLEHSAYPDQAVRTRVLQALVWLDYRPNGAARTPIEAQLEHETAGAYLLLCAQQNARGNAVLAQALRDDGQRALTRLFALLALLYGRATIRRARDTLFYAAAERRGYALELLDNLLAQEHKRLLFPLIEELPTDQRVQQLGARLSNPPDAAAVAAALFDYTHPTLSEWTLATALYGADSAEAVPHARAALSAPQPLVREAALWTLYRQAGRDVAAAAAGPLQADPHPHVAATAARIARAHPGATPMLSTIEKVIILKTVGIFEQTSDAILAEIAQLLEEVEAGPDEMVFAYGDPGNSLYIIVSGRVRVHVGDKELNELGAREVFGEMAVLDPAPRMASVTAMEETLLLRLEQEPLFELMESRSEVSRGIMQVIIRRLRTRVDDLNAMRDQLRTLQGG